jgi:secreted Zn-dependent insulinase-like peptidase
VRSSKSPNYLNSELDKVLSKLYEKIDKLDSEKFDTYKEALNKKLTAAYSNLKQKSDSAWREVYEDTLEFEMKKSYIQQLPNLKVKELQDFFAKNFVGQPKKLSIRIYNEASEMDPILDREESYGYLNSKLKSSVYYNTEFLSAAKVVNKRISGKTGKNKIKK